MTRLAARFSSPTSIRSDVPLTNDQIMRVAPSIFAEGAHHSRSERYTYIPTSEVLNGLREAGFHPFMAGQSRTRIADKREFTRHMLRLRHMDMFKDSDSTQEIILINSHDGTSSYQLLHGVYRFVCMNGMVCGTTENEIRVHHKGNVANQVIDAAFEIVKDSGERQAVIQDMRETNMTPYQQQAFAQAAIGVRFGEGSTTVQPHQVLRVNRYEDADDTQWNVFNRVQENITRGGMIGRNRNNQQRRVREVTGLDKDTQINRHIWTLMQALRAEVGGRVAA